MMIDAQNNKNDTTERNKKNQNNVELVYSGDDYFKRLLNIISNAKTEIHLQTYIFDEDETGLEIANALILATDRNVRVYILLDAFGSSKLSNAFFENLKSQGINIRLFSPFFSINNFYIGRRLHHKIVVVDSKIALIGGINISNKYHGISTEIPWLDFAVQLENNEIAKSIEELCRNIYLKKHRTQKTASFLSSDNEILILQNDWLKQKNEIYNAYRHSFYNANTEIIIVGSYFLPSKRLLNLLNIATRKNVKVKIILSSLSDLPVVMWATKFLYGSLLKQGIELYEWKKSVLHGKLAVVDNHQTIIGSFNLNHLSSYGSIEMNVAINSEDFGKKTSKHLCNIIEQCDKITFETLEERNGIFRRFRNFIAYYITRFFLIIATYIPRKRFFKLY
jgi:cardiolipin synthase A/B